MTRSGKNQNSLWFAPCILTMGLISLGFIGENLIWEKLGFGIHDTKITCMAIHPKDYKINYVGTSKGVYRSINRGRDYAAVLHMSGSDKNINSLHIDRFNPNIIYAATNSGLYKSENSGINWKKIFNAHDENERKCLSVIKDNDRLYVGTRKGLFVRGSQKRNWQKTKGQLGDSPIHFLDKDSQFIYVATDQEIFQIHKTHQTIAEIFSLISSHINGASSGTDSTEENNSEQQIKHLGVLDGQDSLIYLATSRGIFCKHRQESAWRRLNIDGLPLNDATSMIILAKDDLLIGTKKGAFRYFNGRWSPLYRGMETNKITYLTGSHDHGIYAATENGLFTLRKSIVDASGSAVDYVRLKKTFENEPSIQDVHTMAIQYAEVDPQKISDWRSLATKKAWLPSVSIGVDGDKNKTSSDSVYGSYSSGGQDYVGPDDKTFYDNLGWDVSLSWDLSDLVWSTAQTTIDSRSKMMVELREDILDQITRLYFERRRTQIELQAAQALDPQMKIDKQMRIEELTALIDALTGGGFTRETNLIAAGKQKKEVIQ